MFCGNCGKKIRDDAMYCSHCGAATGRSPEDAPGKKKVYWPLILVGGLLVLVGVIVLLLLLFKDKQDGSSQQPEPAKESRETEEAERKEKKEKNDTEKPEDPADTVSDNGTEEAEEAEEDKPEAAEAEEEEEPTSGALEVQVLDPDKGVIPGARIGLWSEKNELVDEKTSGGDGRAILDYSGPGTYILNVSAEDFTTREIKISLNPGYRDLKVAMPPEITGKEAYILLEWTGKRDLDLCGFNSDTGEYIHYDRPQSKAGDRLCGDNDAAEGFEMLYFADISGKKTVRSVFVMDTTAILDGDEPGMEKEGVEVTVFDQSGQIFHMEADYQQRAPLWLACYCNRGVVYAQDNYINDLAGDYAWAAFVYDK
ncbi:MAG: zinc-ribbon domain-containing protein [Lachnospiraceae bacterium]|nr:zinc-ribbon domain-containing protein [Lachnospiraceae bacterium]